MIKRATEIVLDADAPPPPVMPRWNKQQVRRLALCGIHIGPLMYLNTSSVVQPYIQYFERALFEFQVNLHDMICWIEYVQCFYCSFRIP